MAGSSELRRPAGDHDWGISATVDLAESDEAGTAIVRVTAVGMVQELDAAAVPGPRDP